MAENDLSFGRRFSRLVGLSNHHKIIAINTYFWSNRSKSFDKVQIRICPFHVLDYQSSMNAIGVYDFLHFACIEPYCCLDYRLYSSFNQITAYEAKLLSQTK